MSQGENYFFNQEFSWVTKTLYNDVFWIDKNENLDMKQSENTVQCYLVSSNIDQNCTHLQIQTHTYTTYTQKNALYVSTLKHTRTCDPPSGCKEMRPSSFPDPEQAGTESLAFSQPPPPRHAIWEFTVQ